MDDMSVRGEQNGRCMSHGFVLPGRRARHPRTAASPRRRQAQPASRPKSDAVPGETRPDPGAPSQRGLASLRTSRWVSAPGAPARAEPMVGPSTSLREDRRDPVAAAPRPLGSVRVPPRSSGTSPSDVSRAGGAPASPPLRRFPRRACAGSTAIGRVFAALAAAIACGILASWTTGVACGSGPRPRSRSITGAAYPAGGHARAGLDRATARLSTRGR
jgi:hypothetical protein